MAKRVLKVAMCQLRPGAIAEQNVQKAVSGIADAAKQGCDLVVLPECFNSPYGTQYFEKYAEPIPDGPTMKGIRAAAVSNRIAVVAGSIPERRDGKLFNTSVVWSATGEMLTRFSKIHLFAINTPTLKMNEADILVAGDEPAMFELDGFKVGVMICFDTRYPELCLHYQALGVDLIVAPGAFNMITGPAHWLHTARARAIDAQCYFCACSVARDTTATYVAWGHSVIVDPWGDTVATLDAEEGLAAADISKERIAEIRARLPINAGRKLKDWSAAKL
jgi:omega-amidase